MNIIEVNYKWSGTLSKRSKTEMIVLHHAAAQSCSAQDIDRWHKGNGWSGIGYHFFVRTNGQIYRGRPEDVVGAHATNYNSKSIGICFEGDFTKENMTQTQLEAGKALIAYLKDKYKISNVKAHRDLMATSCPGASFPFNEIANAKQSASKENLILAFQQAAQADGYSFSQYGCDGIYGAETEAAMKKCVVKQRDTYKYKNCTKLVQKLLGITADGLCGPNTTKAIKEFQQKRGLESDGCCGPATWKKLLGVN